MIVKLLASMCIVLPNVIAWDLSQKQCNIMPSWKQLSGTFTMRGRVTSNGQPKSGVYVTLQTRDTSMDSYLKDTSGGYSISEPVLTDQNGDFVLQRTFTDYHRCYGDQRYSLHFGKTECDPLDQVFKIADLRQEFRREGNILEVTPYRDVTVNVNMNCR